MNIVPFIHEGLGNSSYLIGREDGRAILIDPDRSVQRYLDTAEARGWRIDSVLETHLHADFVSGAHELAVGIGAKLFVPDGEGLRLPHHGVRGFEELKLNGLAIEVIASPGHTPEHMSYVIRTASHPPVLFSGGSLLVGGAARTDLIAPDMTDALTRAQFRTLTRAFKSLADETQLYPTHGGGSFCSVGGGSARTSTLGQERATNPMLNVEREDEFAQWFPTTFPAAPAYYFRMRAFNAAGPRLRRDIAMPRPMGPNQFAAAANTALIVDTRPVEAYSTAHIRDSLHIEFRDSFAVWLGWLVPAETRLLFVAEPTKLDDIITEALLVGYEDFTGWLDGGIDAWRASGRTVSSTEFVDGAVARSYVAGGATLIDVREKNEYAQRHAPDAQNIPLGSLSESSLAGAEGDPVVAYCGHGERSSTAASLLERAGRTHIVNVQGGLDALVELEHGAKP